MTTPAPARTWPIAWWDDGWPQREPHAHWFALPHELGSRAFHCLIATRRPVWNPPSPLPAGRDTP